MGEDLIRIKNGLYRPVPLEGVKNIDGEQIYMFVGVGVADNQEKKSTSPNNIEPADTSKLLIHSV